MKNCSFLIFFMLPFFAFSQCFTEQSYTTAGESTFTIPGATGTSHLIEIEIKGADGGAFMWGGNPPSEGGEGANMKGSFIVSAGDELLIMVGEKGQNGIGSPAGGGGAGGTAVVINNTDVLIAAGGGGGGGQGGANTGEGGQANTDSPAEGGAGPGTSGGGGFNEDGEDGVAGTAGKAGTLNGWGNGGQGGVVAGGGGAGFGGGGGGSGTVGGGGGGYKGGDGASGTGGDLKGKGGDSYVNTAYSGTVIFNIAGGDGQGSNSDGFVTITCIPLNGVEISLSSQSDATCFGEMDGTITVSAAGGIAPYTYTIDGGSPNDSGIFTGLAAGIYTVQVEDGSGTTDNIQVTIGQPNELILLEISVVDNTCADGMNGSIEVEASGGTSSGTYSYTLNGGQAQSSPIFNDLTAGTYTVAVLDDVNCFEVIILEVEAGPAIESTIQTTDVSCAGDADGSLFIVAFGGNGGFSYSLDGVDFQTSEIFADLSAGMYTVIIKDSEGCTAEESFEIVEPEEIEITLEDSSNPSCNGSSDGSVTLSGNGGTGQYEYAIFGGTFDSNPVISGLSAGEIAFIIMDENGCTDSITVVMQNPDPVDLVLLSKTDVDCGEINTGTANFNLEGASGTTTYTLDGMMNTDGMFSGLASGMYTAFASTAGGCTDSLVIIIGQTSAITITVDNIVDILCAGGTASIEITGGGGIPPYLYSDGGDFTENNVFDNLSGGGAYVFSVQDATGCVSDTAIIVSEPSPIVVDIVSVQATSCFDTMDGEITAIVSGGTAPYTIDGIMYEGDSAEVVISNLLSGTVSIMITDDNGCTSEISVDITSPEPIVLSADSIMAMNCELGILGSAAIDVQGGAGEVTLTMDGNPISGNLTDLMSGSYTVIAEDENGCASSATFDIPKEGELNITTLGFLNVSCHGAADGSINIIEASGGFGMYTYALGGNTDPDVVYGLLDTGTYLVTVVDEAGCEGMIDFEVTQPDILELEVTDYSLGDGTGNGSITVDASGGTPDYIYNINEGPFQGSGVFADIVVMDYTFSVVDANGCIATVDFVLTNSENTDIEEVQVYPNPTANELRFSEELKHIQLIDVNGKVVFSKENSKEINIEHLPNGIYAIMYEFNGELNTKKVVKL